MSAASLENRALDPRMPGLAALAAAVGLALAAPAMADLAGSEWIPRALESGKIGESAGVFVNFGGEGRLSGHVGCHRIAGSYAVAMRGGGADGAEIGKGLAIAIETHASAETVDDCPPQSEALGRAFMDMLVRAQSYARQRADMVLYDALGRPIAHLRQTDWD